MVVLMRDLYGEMFGWITRIAILISTMIIYTTYMSLIAFLFTDMLKAHNPELIDSNADILYWVKFTVVLVLNIAVWLPIAFRQNR